MSGNEKYFEALRTYAREHDVPIIYEDGIELIEKFIKEKNIKTILEIGTAIGYSSSRMASISKDIRIDTVEIREDYAAIAVKNINAANLSEQITVSNQDGLLFETSRSYDMIFIDAAKSQYIRFFEKFKEKLNENGYIVTDNLDFHGYVKQKERIQSKNLRQLVGKIRRYIAFLEDNTDFETEFYDIGDGIAISKKVEK